MKKVVFIDRDGVINKDPAGWTEHSYVTKEKYFIFLPKAVKALEMLNKAGYDIIVVSNQAGVAKGYYAEERLRKINQKMIDDLKAHGVSLKKTYYCIHQDKDNCDCRKPKVGLFKQAEKELNIKAVGSYFVGDGKTDVEAGNKMGLKTILVLSGKTNLEKIKDWNIKPDYIFDDLFEATTFILKGENK